MLKVFKALATISVWALFIVGLGGMLLSTVDEFARAGGSGGESYNFSDAAEWTVSIVSLFLAVAAMKIRKELE